VVLFGDHFLPWAFFRLGGIDGKLSGNSSFSDVDIIGRMQHLVGLFPFWRWEVTGIGSYPSLELAYSLVDNRIICHEEGHPEEHGVSSDVMAHLGRGVRVLIRRLLLRSNVPADIQRGRVRSIGSGSGVEQVRSSL
jgi:hypothetical protein